MEPTNRQATPGARRLFHDLDALKGRGILTGQHTQTVKMEEIDEIRKITGKEPALRGFELLAYSPNIRYETGDEACRTEIDENRDTIEHALAFGRRGGIVTFTWHWFSPMGGQDKSFYSHNTDFDPEKVLEEGSAERAAFYRDLDVIAALLLPFLEEDIPILWRPFHESEGGWFWWGRKGPAVAAKLFRMQYTYFVERYHLNNLLWVWNCPLKEGYPGDDVVDIFSCDLYEEKGTKTDYAAAYEQLRSVMGEEKPVALAEIGILPDMEMLEKSRIPWRYYMTWSKGFVLTEEFNSHEALRRIYDSAYAITDPWER
ncbi:MAG: glycoside hydrolase family 26 protein [Bacteroidales bacterium]|nr:glycoside hydrolase family 26 protein [Bacteroidales bacterium]MCM1416706.1 glycoside hydrolase family 26 protein [bacterium]MCM1424848.1 glycoside hydrolase family 26 protein [bacterium]